MEKKSHILCIDDDDKIRELLEIFLQKHHFRVSTAKDAIEAKKKLERINKLPKGEKKFVKSLFLYKYFLKMPVWFHLI